MVQNQSLLVKLVQMVTLAYMVQPTNSLTTLNSSIADSETLG